MTKEYIITKIHLVISAVIVVPVALVYGFNPSSQFEISPNTIDEFNLLKGIMGLYIGCSVLWILGIFNPKFYRTALISNLVFMLSMGIGRLFSLIIDGLPTFGYLFGTFAELGLGCYGLWLLFRIPSNDYSEPSYSK